MFFQKRICPNGRFVNPFVVNDKNKICNQKSLDKILIFFLMFLFETTVKQSVNDHLSCDNILQE